MAIESHKENSRTRPLEGLRVLVTRGHAQSAEMTSLLEEAGASVIPRPTIEITEPESWAAVDGAIEKLADYDWIVFTSANGVEFFYRRLAGRRLPESIIRCAIGPATAKALETASGRVDVTARDSRAEGALSAIIERAGDAESIRGVRFLIPRARVARDVLPVELSALGAQVDAVEAYQTIKPDTDGDEIKRLLAEGAVDVLTFTSSSTVTNFASIVDVKDMSGLLEGVLIACIGPVTAQTARAHGISKIIQPDQYNASALVEALIAATRKS